MEPILSGWADFDAVAPLVPGRVTLLEGPDGLAMDLALALAADAVLRGGRVRVADAAGVLDVRCLARSTNLRVVGPEALERVDVAYGFSLREAPRVVEAIGLDPDAGLLVVLGLAEAWLDDGPGRVETRVLVGRTLEALRRTAQLLGVPALVVHRMPPSVGPRALQAALEAGVDEAICVWRDGEAAHVVLPRRGARFLSRLPGGAPARKHRG